MCLFLLCQLFFWFPVSDRLPVSCVYMFSFSRFPVFLFSVFSWFLFSSPVCFPIFSSFSILYFPADFFSDWNLWCDTPRLRLCVELYFDKIPKKDSESFLERFRNWFQKRIPSLNVAGWNVQFGIPRLGIPVCN